MDLLEEEKKVKKKNNKGQKIVLVLLIISVILCFVVGALILYLRFFGGPKEYSILINGEKIILGDIELTEDENGHKYVSLKKLANKLKFNYYNGEYNVAGEGKDKGYIDNGLNIIQFYKDSKNIFKTTENSLLGYEYYELKNKIIEKDENLYINIEDIAKGLNMIVNYSSKLNQLTIETPQNFVQSNLEKLKTAGIEINTENENLRALGYGYVIIKKDDKIGVINLKGEEIIGNKYKNVIFNEYTCEFIVSNIENKYGTITPDGKDSIGLQYDEIEIISYNPLLYKVKKTEKYGILNKDGIHIGEIKYSYMGYPENRSKGINYTLIVPELNENIPQSIVVREGNKYGLLDLEKGIEIVPCDLDGIYSVTNNDKDYYIFEINKQVGFLEDYVKDLNRYVVTLQ